MSQTVTLVFSPFAPTTTEIAEVLTDFPQVRVSSDQVVVCALSEREEDDAGTNECIWIRPLDLEAEVPPAALSDTWKRKNDWANGTTFTVDYHDEELARWVIRALANRFEFLFHMPRGEVTASEQAADVASSARKREARGPQQRSEDNTQDRPSTLPGPSTSEAAPLLWRWQSLWRPPIHLDADDLAVLIVVSLKVGPVFDLSGRVAPGLSRWFAHRLREWRAEIGNHVVNGLDRSTAYLFLVARANSNVGTERREGLAWYRDVGIGQRGFGNTSDIVQSDMFLDLPFYTLVDHAIEVLDKDT